MSRACADAALLHRVDRACRGRRRSRRSGTASAPARGSAATATTISAAPTTQRYCCGVTSRCRRRVRRRPGRGTDVGAVRRAGRGSISGRIRGSEPAKSVGRRDLTAFARRRRSRPRSRAAPVSRARMTPPADPAAPHGLSYRDAGVDIDAGDALVERIKPFAKRTMRPEVLAGIGGFGALFEIGKQLHASRCWSPAPTASAPSSSSRSQLDRHDTIGIDLVAMSVNDILVQGAEPLFFLDYFATRQARRRHRRATVIAGIAAGCEQAGCALIGGETAEMPGMYPRGRVRPRRLRRRRGRKDAHHRRPRRSRRATRCSGSRRAAPHSNGYSLVRRIVDASRHADLRRRRFRTAQPLGRGAARRRRASTSSRCWRCIAATCASRASRTSPAAA